MPRRRKKAIPWESCECGLIHIRGCHHHVRIYDEDRTYIGSRPCARSPVKGTTLCPKHGGTAKHIRQAGHLRLLELVDPALGALARVLDDEDAQHADLVRAATAVLDRVRETAKVLRNEHSGPEGGPIPVEDPKTQALAEALKDPKKARRLDRVARDLHLVKPAEEETG